MFKKTAVVVNVVVPRIPGEPGEPEEHQIEFSYSNIAGPIYTGSHLVPSLTLTTDIAPKMFRLSLAMAMEELVTRFLRSNQPKKSRKRITQLGGPHEHVASSCFTYRFLLGDPQDIPRVRHLATDKHVPDMVEWFDHVAQPITPYYLQITRFVDLLKNQDLVFRIKFQLQKLVWNGSLSPMKVAELIPYVYQLVDRLGPDRSVQILSRLSLSLRYAGPDVERSAFDVKTIAGQFSDFELDSSYRYQDISNTAREGLHQIVIHHATVTPAGIYLTGPKLETKNRVLRLYSDFRDFFLRVEFLDETGDPVRYDPTANLDEIFQGRFKTVLLEGIHIAGRHFKFLGFSHSSLRYQTCWFVAAFRYVNEEIIDAHSIIPKLGDFSRIRSPARCAARIGQTFSDTTTSIKIHPDLAVVVGDVKRNDRVFSDGVGTLSREVMHKIWREYAHRAKVKPTVFQIRFAGKFEAHYPF